MPAPLNRRRRVTTKKGEPSEACMAGWTEEEREKYRHEQAMELPLSEVPGVTVRVINTLEDEGVLLVRELLRKSAAELLNVPNFGEKTLREVRDAIKRLGLKTTWRLPAKRRRGKK